MSPAHPGSGGDAGREGAAPGGNGAPSPGGHRQRGPCSGGGRGPRPDQHPGRGGGPVTRSSGKRPRRTTASERALRNANRAGSSASGTKRSKSIPTRQCSPAPTACTMSSTALRWSSVSTAGTRVLLSTSWGCERFTTKPFHRPSAAERAESGSVSDLLPADERTRGPGHSSACLNPMPDQQPHRGPDLTGWKLYPSPTAVPRGSGRDGNAPSGHGRPTGSRTSWPTCAHPPSAGCWFSGAGS